MNDTPAPGPEEPPNLRFLRRLVTGLTATMIVGLIIIVALFVMRLRQDTTPLPFPAEIALPEGARALAFTRGEGWIAVVVSGPSEGQEILIYDAGGKRLRQRIAIAPEG